MVVFLLLSIQSSFGGKFFVLDILIIKSNIPILNSRFLFVLQTIYNFISLMFTWFSIGNFFLAFFFLFDVAGTSKTLDVKYLAV